MGANQQTSVPAFTAGQVLTAQQQTEINTGVPVFATTTTRDAAFGGAGEKTLDEGQMCYIEAAPKRFQVYNGTVWRDFDTTYQTFTPTWTNLTVGNATQDFEYVRLGQFVHFFGKIVFGSTTSVSGTIGMSFPVNADTTLNSTMIAYCDVTDSGTANYLAGWYQASTSRMDLFAENVSAVYTTAVASNATTPMTWATNDVININLVYKAA